MGRVFVEYLQRFFESLVRWVFRGFCGFYCFGSTFIKLERQFVGRTSALKQVHFSRESLQAAQMGLEALPLTLIA
ncbi:MAG: hypothetical protein NVS9B14_13050 [Candidatus Acidiferrum sp.]